MKGVVENKVGEQAGKMFVGFTVVVSMALWSFTLIYKGRLYDLFVREISSVPWFGKFAELLAVAFLAVEVLILLLLIFERTRKAGLTLSAVLLSIFTGYIVYILTALAYPPCSCAGIIPNGNWTENLILTGSVWLFNVVALGMLLKRKNTKENSIENFVATEEGVAEYP